MEYVTLTQPAILIVTLLVAFTLAATSIYRTRRVVATGVGEGERRMVWRFRGRRLRYAALTALTGILIAAAIVVTPPGHRGVIYTATGGINETERNEGFSLIVPVFQSAVQVNTQVQKWATEEAFSQSSDLQEITVHVAVNYQVDPGSAAELYRDVGRTYPDTLIKPAVLQLVKQHVGLIKAEAFASSREQLARDIATGLRTQLDPFGIAVLLVNIEDAVFQPAFITAVQNKVIAEERAREQERLVVAARHEAEQVYERADGEARAKERLAEAERRAVEEVAAALGFTPTEYLTYLFEKQWNGSLPSTLVGDGSLDVLLGIGGPG